MIGRYGNKPSGRRSAPAQPDILCVQEALEGQVKYLEATLPGHRRVGAGRDDGRSAGEHCAIYFDGDRFEPLGEGTFWLEEPADEPPAPADAGPQTDLHLGAAARPLQWPYPPRLQHPPLPDGAGPPAGRTHHSGADRRGRPRPTPCSSRAISTHPQAPPAVRFSPRPGWRP